MYVINDVVIITEDDLDVFDAILGEAPRDRSVAGVLEYLDLAIEKREAETIASTVVTVEQVMTIMLKNYRKDLTTCSSAH